MQKSQRIPALDVAKGIGIICVVLGHSMNVYTVPGMFFYTFHMPLFFLLSGLCFSPERNREFRPFLTKRCRQLVVPAFLFAGVIIAVYHASPRLMDYDLSLLLWEGLPHALWFLLVLFAVEIVFFWIVKLFNRGGTQSRLRSAASPSASFWRTMSSARPTACSSCPRPPASMPWATSCAPSPCGPCS